MVKLTKSKTDKVFQEGYDEGYKESQDLSVEDFARLSYLLSEDHTIDHKDAGYLIYKLHHKLKVEKLQHDKK